jgi:hypothetical protein
VSRRDIRKKPSDLSLGQQFAHLHRVPEGRLMSQASPLSRPSGTHWQNIGISIPAINRWAIISRPSGTKYIGARYYAAQPLRGIHSPAFPVLV